jgi:thiol-disulfide isomerase/thioredoxin
VPDVSAVGVIVVVLVLAAGTAVGLRMRARSGRVRTVAPEPTSPYGWALASAAPADGDRFLLLQLSSPICTPCRQTAAMLGELVASEPGIRHVEIDVANSPDIARELSIMRTPTTVGFDRDGRELLRIAGVPRRNELLAALKA